MVSVPEAVRQILTRNYPIYQSLKMRVVNYHSLAERIRDQVNEATGREPSINTLVVAIKRFADTLELIESPTMSGFLNGARITLSNGVVDMTIKALKTEFPRIVKDVADVGKQLSEFPHVFPLLTSVKIILLAEDYEPVAKSIQGLGTIESRRNVSKLMLHLSPGAEMTQGTGAYITELLYRNGINVLDAFLGYGDMLMVVNGEDGPTAFNILQKEIDDANNSHGKTHSPSKSVRPSKNARGSASLSLG